MAKSEPISVKDAVHKLQLSLLEGIRHENQLLATSSLISKSDYEDVVIERSISNVCGYPLCQNSLPSNRPRKGRYRISLKEHKVYDLHETYLYCSTSCVVNSRTFAESLEPERSSDYNPAQINDVLNLFGELSLDDNDLGKKGILGVTDLKIEENLDVKKGNMCLDDWIGPSNAIEGYIPLIDRSSKPSKHLKHESNSKKARAKEDKGKLVNDLDFTSTIIVGDQFSVPKLSSDSRSKSNISKVEESKRAQVINFEASSLPVESAANLSTLVLESQYGIPEMVYDFDESVSSRADYISKSAKKSNKKVVEKRSQSNDNRAENVSDRGAKKSEKEVYVEKTSQSNQASLKSSKSNISKVEELKRAQVINFEASSIPVENGANLSTLALESQFGIPEMVYDFDESVPSRDECISKSAKKSNKKVVEKRPQAIDYRAENVSDRGAKESEKEVYVEKTSQSNQASLKSSMKSSGSKKVMRSVTWADERNTSSAFDGERLEAQEVGDAKETAETSSISIGESGDGSIRFASAEACVLALSQAAEAVASGEADVTDAVSEAGILILPQPHDADGYSQEDEDPTETDLVPLKWPKKPGVLNSEVFSTEDSWFESPPEGFNLTLSSFATMYMALFGWMTSSSLAYIYGQDESSHEEFLNVNGREYPCKIVLSDGRSSEIKLALGGCLSRAIPKVATDLRLKTPVFAIEKEVGHLLNTMSFIDAIPSFRLKQWHVIALLFVDALSVCRIPGLALHMTSGRILLQKVLDGAQVSGEEYEIMKDLLIPLGRVPQFSAQSGA